MVSSGNNPVSKIFQFWQKHRFPKHLVGIIDRSTNTLCRALSTAHAKIMLSIQGCCYGENLRIDGRLLVRTIEWGTISIGRNFLSNSRPGSNLVGLTGPTTLSCEAGGCIEIGNNVGLSGVVISSRIGVRIGNRVQIGGNVRIFDHDFHSVDANDRRDSQADYDRTKKAPVMIGDDVFIGTNAIILKGVSIGNRSLVGAGSVVRLKHIPEDSIVFGNPAVIVRRTGI